MIDVLLFMLAVINQLSGNMSNNKKFGKKYWGFPITPITDPISF